MHWPRTFRIPLRRWSSLTVLSHTAGRFGRAQAVVQTIIAPNVCLARRLIAGPKSMTIVANDFLTPSLPLAARVTTIVERKDPSVSRCVRRLGMFADLRSAPSSVDP